MCVQLQVNQNGARFNVAPFPYFLLFIFWSLYYGFLENQPREDLGENPIQPA